MNKLLRRYFYLLITNKNRTLRCSPFFGVIPKDLAGLERDSWLPLSTEEYDLYTEIYDTIKRDKKAEYLSDREIKDKLWWHTCNACNYKDPAKIKELARNFIDSVFAEMQKYEVLFYLEGADHIGKEIELEDSKIFQINKKWFDEWLGSSSRSYDVERFESKPVIIVKEHGTACTPVTDRAREKGIQVAVTLRVMLRVNRQWWDDQLLFTLSDISLCKKCDSGQITVVWKVIREPMRVNLGSEPESLAFFDKYREFMEDSSIKKGAKDAIKRAVKWISNAIVTVDLDFKVIFLCSALESLLCTQMDGKKGESLAYRMAILATETGNSFLSPAKMLFLYDIRSSVVHGSKLNCASKTDYITLLHISYEMLEWTIDLIVKYKPASIGKFIEYLESSKSYEQIIEWLEDLLSNPEISKNDSKNFENILSAIKDNAKGGAA